MTNVIKKRGPGRPKGSKNKKTKVVATTTKIKRGRGRPKGSKNKQKQQEVILPFPNPSSSEERIANIRYMSSFYQHSDGRKKGMGGPPKKRGRKSKVETLDEKSLLKQDLDSDHLVYTDDDVRDELSRTDAYQDFISNRRRYSNSF